MRYKKNIHLKEFNYQGSYRYFVTICTSNKKTIFTDTETVSSLINILKETAEKYGFNVWCYVFMPDHLHLLVEGKNDTADLKKFVSVYKQKCGYKIWKEKKLILWQENYYEHILRNEEDTLTVVKYILNNPVRKGLVVDFENYLYSGSFMLDIRNF